MNLKTEITKLTVPDSVTKIGSRVFSNCSSLTSITIPDSVTEIGYAAFYNCSSLTSITIPDGVTYIGSDAFAYCSRLTSVTIPDSVTSIGGYAFSNCSSLKAFYGKFASSDNRCLIINGVLNSFAPEGLISYSIPDSVTSIEDSVFYNCYNLKTITVPDSVTKIGEDAFNYCSSLTSVYCKPTIPPTMGSNAFYGNASGRKIYVPEKSLDAYKNADGWKDYANAIVGYDF